MRAAHQYNLAIEEQRQRFLQVLRGPPNVWRVPFRPLSDIKSFVDRPGQLGEAKAKLLRGGTVALTAALRGPGGFGKTALAAQLAQDRDVRDLYYDGVLWVTLGEQPVDPVPKLADLIYEVHGERPGFTGLDAARAAFAKALDDRRCLLVLDDVWRLSDVKPFMAGGSRDRTARLITTRDRAAIPDGAAAVIVEEMEGAEALHLLGRGLPEAGAARPALKALAEQRFGGWALLLELGNGLLRDRVAKGQSLADALAYLDQALTRRGVARAFTRGDMASGRRSAEGTVALSLEGLPREMVARAEEMGAFAEDADITLASAAQLWGLDEFDAE